MSLIIATYKGHSGVKFTNSLEAAISEKKMEMSKEMEMSWKYPRYHCSVKK